jgi:hypothetical protein
MLTNAKKSEKLNGLVLKGLQTHYSAIEKDKLKPGGVKTDPPIYIRMITEKTMMTIPPAIGNCNENATSAAVGCYTRKKVRP